MTAKLLAITLVVAACAGGPADPAPPGQDDPPVATVDVADDGIPWDALAQADALTIRRTSHVRAEEGEAAPLFRVYAERAVTEVTDAEIIGGLLGALRAGVEESDGTIARCFVPRHVISAEVGGVAIDLLICYECYQIHYVRRSAHAGARDEVYTTVPVTDTPREAFERLFTAAGI